MKFILALSLLVACASAASLFEQKLDVEWSSYKNLHGKVYSAVEEPQRRAIWEKNLKIIAKHNAEEKMGKHTFTLGMNKYGDMTSEEFVGQMNGYNMTKTMKKTTKHVYMKPENVAAPDAIDWRTQGYVTGIKDQGQCGSCWAFSTVAGLEGQHFRATGDLVSLSEQNLVDCSIKYGNLACNGGLMDNAFDYIIANGGIDTEESYPYTASLGVCKYSVDNIGATATGYTDIKSGSEEDLTNSCGTVGPISVAIDASHPSFQLYKSGIYNEPRCSSTQLDHGVTVVGYDSLGAGQDYYIVKNSWGTSWGQEGYLWMSRNKNNQCGIATSASYPLV